MNARERAEFVVALHEQRMVWAVERGPGESCLGRQLLRLVGKERELCQVGPAGTAVKASRSTPRSARSDRTRYAAPISWWMLMRVCSGSADSEAIGYVAQPVEVPRVSQHAGMR